jgi:hypothetical protein
MMSYFLAIIIGLLVFAGLVGLALTGFRNGDREEDALVSAVLRPAGQPGERRPVVVATVRNPARSPMLAGLRVRRAWRPAWLAGSMDSGVPRWTARRKFRPVGYPTVGVVSAGGTAELALPVTADARRYLLTVAVGEGDGRLRVHRLRLTTVIDARTLRVQSRSRCPAGQRAARRPAGQRAARRPAGFIT